MDHEVRQIPRTAALLAIATMLAGVGALLWRDGRQAREAHKIRVAHAKRLGDVPVWARATAIVASSASALLLLVREKKA